jgi:hypothetical protein
MINVHSLESIENLLRRGLTPVTGNCEALRKLGFTRAYPQAASGRDSTIWERSIDHGRRAGDGSRMLVRQRAIFADENA